ncbi:MAG: LysR family transcriptional regulator [Bdellovibrionales bacterium]|nr:LysR family transcriptional regulator [Bdellovibrionales bacterium]NQZ18716.1 LysR family transcriptional regulator [Bdellovibrionales bacterium]
MTFEQIKCFQAVIETGSFSKAAQRLFKAKSAVMYSVKTLEEQLGFALIDRSEYRSKITPQGEAFLFRCQKVLNDMDELNEYAQLIASGVEMNLKISASGIFNIDLLYPILKKAMSVFPSTEIMFEREILSGEKMLRRGDVDLAILENLHNKRDYDFKHINSEKMMLVIANDHQFLSLPKKEQNKEGLYRYPQVIQRSTIRDEDVQVGVHHESLKWKVTDTPSKREIILNGLGWGRLPEHIVKKDIKKKKLTHLKAFKDDDTVDFYLCKKKDTQMGQVAQFIWDCF